MTKKKSILMIALALVLGLAIGAGVTAGITYNKAEGTIYVPSETEMETGEYSFPYIDSLVHSESSCSYFKLFEVLKQDGVVVKERIVSAKWKITLNNFFSDSIAFFTKTISGKTTVEKYMYYDTTRSDNDIKATVTYIPIDPLENIFRDPEDYAINLHLFVKLGDRWVSDDGKLEVTDPDAFFAGTYTKESVIFHGTEEELSSSDYCFLRDYVYCITMIEPTE